MPLILAFAHKRRAGKDTAVKFAMAHLAFTRPALIVKRVSFADKLKNVAHQLYGWAGLREGGYYEDHPEAKETALPALLDLGAISPRDIYIHVGQAMRSICAETWIKSAFTGLQHADVILVSDCRFPNEAEHILELSGKVFNIVRPDAPPLDDPSETALDGYDFTENLLNGGSLKQFNELVIKTVEKYL